MVLAERENELLGRIAELEEALEDAIREALTCPLTGVFNRRGWEQALAREQSRCQRHGLDAVVVALDLDGFKRLNSDLGHHAADAVLCRCADVLRRAVREHDVVARPGGDEFAVLATATEAAMVGRVVRRLSDAIATADISATLGAAAFSEAGRLDAAWQTADRRMLARKTARGSQAP